MTESANQSWAGASRNRPHTPQDFTLLKTTRHEDAAHRNLPLPLASINLPESSQEFADSKRPTPRTSESLRSRIRAQVSTDEKRDSAIAPSLSITDHASYAGSQLSRNTSLAGAAKEPALPKIVLQNGELSAPLEKNRSPFAKRWTKDKQPKTMTQPVENAMERIQTFKGIESDIPSGSFADIDLEDLATDKIAFSHRGSLMFGGKKMKPSPDSPSDDTVRAASPVQPASHNLDGTPSKEGGPVNRGLVAGPRKPSAQRLQDVIQSGKVLSAEEMAFSVRVRSMYDYGDERAAEWVKNTENGSAAESVATDNNSTPEPAIDSTVADKTRRAQPDEQPALPSPTPDVRASYYREPTELAGGIEDWENVNVQDVDRYGFINAKRRTSGSSIADRGTGDGLQRVATSLRLEAEQPRGQRKLRRGLSAVTRKSNSVPPRSSRDSTVGVASLYSVQSRRSITLHSGNPFRSRDRRARADASDMLTLPPGLADIAEQEDGGRTASMLKRREWAREEKWQGMARQVPQLQLGRDWSTGKGGGMRFEFETSDQKLISRTWKGIPDRWRATAWQSFLAASAKKRRIGESDGELAARFHKLQDESSADDVQIDVDVPRTINLHIMFRRRYRGGQRLLFRVLHAISLYFPDIGYVQGMASIAATLLCYYDEEQAFVMMVRLWQLRGLEALFQSGFDGLMNALNEFEKDWLRDGDVAQKLAELGITSTAYGTRWYLTLFNMSLPFPAQLRIWDVFMLLGDATDNKTGPFGGAELDVLHATSAALIDATRAIIVDSDFENAMKVLTSFIPIKDEDMLMRVARAEWKMRKKRGPAKT